MISRVHPTGLVALLALGLTATPCAAQQMWAPSGVRLCLNGCVGDAPRVVPDGVGGAFVAWRDAHNSDDVFIQHLTGPGLVAPGWPPAGLPVVVLSSSQELSGLAPDGMGGALVAWEDLRSGRKAYVQRILADGSFPPGWPVNGTPATIGPGGQFYPQVAPDGSGGAYLLWQDDRDLATAGDDAYAQHLTASGTVASGWPGGGLRLVDLPGNQGSINFVLPDDSGGAVFIWSDGRPGAPGGYALRVHADGTIAAGWTANGILLATDGVRAAARDEAGGFYTVSPTPGPTPGFDGTFYLKRITFTGTLAAGWPAGGVAVCSAPGDRAGLSIHTDALGGVLLSWYDYRPPLTGSEIFALRVRSDGSIAPGWALDGTLISDPSSPLSSYDPFIVQDGLGGAYIAWQAQGSGGAPSFVQHLTASGQVAAGWPQYGLRLAPSFAQYDTRIAADGQGGAIVAWDEGCCGRIGVWAQRFGPDGPTPVLLSLVSAEVTGGRVELDWFAADGAGLSATAYRRTDHSDWITLGSVSADGSGHMRYEDRAVSPGTRYGYRLGYLEQGREQFTSESWVAVPVLKLALEGLRPNPAGRELAASFTLPSGAPARLQMLDVTGRVWLAREVGSLGAGNHLVHLTEGASVPAGIYWLRLTQGGRSLLARGVVVR